MRSQSLMGSLCQGGAFSQVGQCAVFLGGARGCGVTGELAGGAPRPEWVSRVTSVQYMQFMHPCIQQWGYQCPIYAIYAPLHPTIGLPVSNICNICTPASNNRCPIYAVYAPLHTAIGLPVFDICIYAFTSIAFRL